jgi:fatty-acid desaturase
VEGYVTPIKSPYSVELLVDSIWWQWLGWLLAMQIAQIKKASTRQLVTDGMINIMFLNQHYANRVVFRAIRIEIQKIARRSSPGPSASAVV